MCRVKLVHPGRWLAHDERNRFVVGLRVNVDRAPFRRIHACIFNELRENLRQASRVAADKGSVNAKTHRHAMTPLRERVAGKRVRALDNAVEIEGHDFELDGTVQDSRGVDEAIDRLKRYGERLFHRS